MILIDIWFYYEFLYDLVMILINYSNFDIIDVLFSILFIYILFI